MCSFWQAVEPESRSRLFLTVKSTARFARWVTNLVRDGLWTS